LPAGTRLGPYEIVSLVGAGGMGEVYRAHDDRLGRDVAIKTIAPHLASDPDALARFQREARAIAALSHPNILAIFDVGRQDDIWYVVTELLDGETVRDRIARGTMEWIEAVRIGAAVADGLEAAHARSIVHRDIKPANVFLTTSGGVKILDFGLARQGPLTTNAEAETRQDVFASASREIAGTIGYMSPEQIQGRSLDGRTDLFSLGCVLYEMIVGKPPFAGESPADVLAAILKDPVWSLSGPVPAPTEQIVRRCLEKDRDARFPSAGALASALRAPSGGRASGGHRVSGPVTPTVAVLPFRNISADQESEFFADGVTEDVIAHLAKIRSLSVISRTSVAAFKKHDQSLREIGRRLGAGTIVEGSVRRFGSRVRIVADLIDAESDRHIWAETYDRDLTDIFAIQTEVALQIARALSAELSADEQARIQKAPARDLYAYQLYLEGRQYAIRYTEDGFRRALDCFARAIERDPEFALAYVGAARTYVEAVLSSHVEITPDIAFSKAKAAIGKALAIDEHLGDAHGIVALLKFTSDYDWIGAERSFLLALDLSPGSADIYDYYGWLCSSLGRFDDSIRLVRRATELDPLAHRTDLTTELLRAGRVDEALTLALRIVEAEPGLARAHSTLGWAYLLSGRLKEGVAALEHTVAVSNEVVMFVAQLGEAYAMAGEVEKARAVLTKLHGLAKLRYIAPYYFAYVHTGLGELDIAMDWLDRSYEEHAGSIYGIKGSFLFTPLRTHPRFVALLKKMNLA
jgi:serine/threonine protein kinase/tetratricopeptide (TPR) repeat protein